MSASMSAPMSALMSVPVSACIGFLAGLHCSIWGMYKDSIHEGFTTRTFARSAVIGALVAVAIQWTLQLPLHTPGGLALLFGLAYAAERGIVETWKTFVRVEDQSKYFIPMQFSLGGKPVEARGWRLAAGVAYVVIVALVLVAIARVGDGSLPRGVRAASIGLAVGIIIAIGGGWKDAPKEGFSILKFFRSPAMTVIYALLLSRITSDGLQIAAASIGFERATAETYKTFFFPSRPRGKFSGKPILFPEMLRRRRLFVPAYAAITGAAVVCMLIAL